MDNRILKEEDQQFLNRYLECFKIFAANTHGLLGGVASLNRIPLYKIRLVEEFGVSDEELRKLLFKPELIALFNEVISSKTPRKFLTVREFPDYPAKMFVLNWSPVINPDTGNIVAIYSSAHLLEVGNMSNVFARFYKYGDSRIRKDGLPTDLNLTQREKQVVFFFLLNFESQTIAELIARIEGKTISKNAIDQVFTKQLLPKFGVYSRKALYEKLQDLGYDRLIPHNILQDGFTLDLTDYVVFA